MKRFGEAEIKAAVLNRLREQGRIDRRSVLASEFCLGRTGVRTDLAVQAGQFIGIEIKSELDSLRRLAAQLSAYRSHFDITVLVVATRHLPAVAAIDLSGLELWECAADGALRITQAMASGPVPEPCWTDLMTQVERRRFSAEDGRWSFQRAFEYRFAATSREFWRAVGRRKIKPEDLTKLSRFRDARLSQAALVEARTAKWSDFADRARRLLEMPAEPVEAA